MKTCDAHSEGFLQGDIITEKLLEKNASHFNLKPNHVAQNVKGLVTDNSMIHEQVDQQQDFNGKQVQVQLNHHEQGIHPENNMPPSISPATSLPTTPQRKNISKDPLRTNPESSLNNAQQIFSEIISKSNESALKQVIANKVLTRTPNIRDAFRIFDIDHDGVINKTDFKKGLDNININLNANEIEQILSSVTSDGVLDFKKFSDFVQPSPFGLTSTQVVASPNSPRVSIEKSTLYHKINQKLLQRPVDCAVSFSEFDKNKTGQVSFEDFSTVIGNLGIHLNKEEMHKVSQTCCAKPGTVDYNAFSRIFYTGPNSIIAPEVIPEENESLMRSMKREFVEVSQGNTAKLRSVFNSNDPSNSGTLSRQAFANAIRSLNKYVPDWAIEHAIRVATTTDGKCDYNSFLKKAGFDPTIAGVLYEKKSTWNQASNGSLFGEKENRTPRQSPLKQQQEIVSSTLESLKSAPISPFSPLQDSVPKHSVSPIKSSDSIFATPRHSRSPQKTDKSSLEDRLHLSPRARRFSMSPTSRFNPITAPFHPSAEQRTEQKLFPIKKKRYVSPTPQTSSLRREETKQEVHDSMNVTEPPPNSPLVFQNGKQEEMNACSRRVSVLSFTFAKITLVLCCRWIRCEIR